LSTNAAGTGFDVGIDLGTTNSVISVLRAGRAVPIAIDGSPIVPSVVHLDETGRFRAGREARNLELLHPERTVRSVKRKMGSDHRFQIGDRALGPEELSAEVLGALKRGAEAELGGPVRDAVITVPAYFDDAQRHATLRAGELAGLNVLRLLNEPTSASLVYDHVGAARAADAPELVLIYDLGGGTFDVSVLEVFEGVREVRATAGNTTLGGDDFDDLVLGLFVQELKRRHGVDPREDVRAMARLRRLAEDTKIRLSADTVVEVREEFLTGTAGHPIHLQLSVSRRDLERLIAPLVDSTIDLCRRALADAGVAPEQIARVCLVGGSTRIPLVRSRLEEALGAAVHEDVDPDLAVGLGASLQAGLLRGSEVGRILVDVTAHSLGVKVIGAEDDPEADEDADTFAPVLKRNTVLPATRAEEFYTAVDDQEWVEVEVFQGEERRCSENRRVGAFRFELSPAPVHSPVRFELAYDLSGVVRVSVAQPGTSNAKTVALKLADAGKAVQGQKRGRQPAPPEGASDGVVVRKARALLDGLDAGPRARVEALIAAVNAAAGDARAAAEDQLLDLLMQLDEARAAGAAGEAPR
jgi:molecular chaperone DnaK